MLSKGDLSVSTRSFCVCEGRKASAVFVEKQMTNICDPECACVLVMHDEIGLLYQSILGVQTMPQDTAITF